MDPQKTDSQHAGDRLRLSIRNRLISGLVVIVPLGITVLILKFIYHITAGYLTPLIRHFFGPLPAFYIAAISIVVLLVLLYFVGVFATHVVGRRLIAMGESLLLRIPLVKVIYSAAKQAIETLAMPNRTAFRSVVLIEFPRPGLKALGFTTGMVELPDGKKLCKVFIPTTPNPTTGFLELVSPDELIETTISVEDGIKMIVSGGILSPQKIASIKSSQSTQQPPIEAGKALSTSPEQTGIRS